MAPSELNQVSLIIGGLQTAVETLTVTWREQDRRATESRQRLYESFDELKGDIRDRVAAMEHIVGRLASDVAEMKPAVEDWKAVKLEAKGATFTAKLMARGLYLLISAALVGAGWLFAHVTVLAR